MNEYIEYIIYMWPKILFIFEGSITTLQYSSLAVMFGLIIGVILLVLRRSHFILLKSFAHIYVSIFRGTPLLIQLSLIYFAMPGLINVKLDVFTAGVLAFSLNSGAYVSEILRAGINSVDVGQVEAAKALGIPPALRMKDIILPQAIRHILPSLVNELINLIKESAIISVIGGMDLMRRANLVASESFDFFMPMLAAAFAYYVMVMIISIFAIILEKRLAI